MLATLLPGLRNVRTPLAVGYLYLLAGWLILGPQRLIPSKDDDGAVGRLAQLVDVIGPTATFTAVTFAAYLLGSIVEIKSWPFGISPKIRLDYDDNYSSSSYEYDEDGFRDDFYDHIDVSSHHLYTAPWAEGLMGWANEALDEVAGDLTYRQLNDSQELPRRFYKALDEMWDREYYVRLERLRSFSSWESRGARRNNMTTSEFQAETRDRRSLLDFDAIPSDALEKQHGTVFPKEGHPYWKLATNLDSSIPAEHLREVFDDQMDDEIELVTARLRAQNQYVFDETDRLGTEASLRYSIVPPLIVIAVTAAITWQWWAIALLVLPAVLLRQAYTIERASVIEVLAAIQYGNVASPTADALRNALRAGSEDIDPT